MYGPNLDCFEAVGNRDCTACCDAASNEGADRARDQPMFSDCWTGKEKAHPSVVDMVLQVETISALRRKSMKRCWMVTSGVRVTVPIQRKRDSFKRGASRIGTRS